MASLVSSETVTGRFSSSPDSIKFFNSLDEKAIAYFPEYEIWVEEGKKDITVKHLLTMTSGLDWDEVTHSFLSLRNDTV